MAGSQISTSVSIIDSLSGFMALSLTEYNTSAAAAIAAGSKVEIAGAFFQFPADETPTGWAAIVTATTAYIALTASGTAGSQVVNAGYVSTAPTWRDDLQGWYASAASSVRIVASVYKAEATRYYPKFILSKMQDSKQKQIEVERINGTPSVETSMTIAGYPVSTVINTATSSTVIYPIGTIVSFASSTTTNIGNIITIMGSAGSYFYFSSSISATGGLTLSGNWQNRGACGGALGTLNQFYMAQRIS